MAPTVIVYESNSDNDYLLTEAIAGEDGVADIHLENPNKLATDFGKYLGMLHSISTIGCPYENRMSEILDEHCDKNMHMEEKISTAND